MKEQFRNDGLIIIHNQLTTETPVKEKSATSVLCDPKSSIVYKQFIPVLEVYIMENYSATLAYNKLLVVVRTYGGEEWLNGRILAYAFKPCI